MEVVTRFIVQMRKLALVSRIMTVADIFTAISEDRPYRKGMNKNEIHKIIKNQTNQKLLDQRIVELLFDNYETVSN